MRIRQTDPGAGCTAFRWPPSCPVSPSSPCVSTNSAGYSPPTRTPGGTRRYSDDDLARLQRITELLAAGVNVAGVAHVLDLQDRNSRLESDNAALKSDNVQLTSGRRPTGAPNCR